GIGVGTWESQCTAIADQARVRLCGGKIRPEKEGPGGNRHTSSWGGEVAGSFSIVSKRLEKSFVGMSVCTTVIGAVTPPSRRTLMAMLIGSSSLRAPARPRTATTT